jgi:hypothetical protein
MAKLKIQYRVSVDDRDAMHKFEKIQRAADAFRNALEILKEDIKIGIQIVPIKNKKWWQIWKYNKKIK